MKETPTHSGKDFTVETDASGAYWCNRAENTLPPPDMMGAYMRNRPVADPARKPRKAWILGSGIAGLAAAFYLMRDGGMAGEDITILDALHIEGPVAMRDIEADAAHEPGTTVSDRGGEYRAAMAVALELLPVEPHHGIRTLLCPE